MEFKAGNLTVDDEAFVASLNGRKRRLTASQYRILLYMARRSHRLVTRVELYDLLSPDKRMLTKKIGDNYIYRIHKKFPGWNIDFDAQIEGWRFVDRKTD